MKILLCCAAGMSTSLLVRKLQAIASRDKKSYVIKAMDQDRAELHLKNFDVILIGPQIKYALPKLKKLAESHEIPVEVINPTDYGKLNAEAILAFAEHLFEKKKAKLNLGGKFMINIMLVCSAGMSTSLLVNKMKDHATQQSMEVNIWANSEAEAKSVWEKADIILLGPQVKYLEPKIKEMVQNKIPVAVIDMMSYGTMNGKKVLEDALAKLG
jgi:cellobiose PTS system EIIB component